MDEFTTQPDDRAAEPPRADRARRRARTGPTIAERWAAFRWDWEAVGWLVVIALAVVSRLVFLGERAMSHDESLHTFYSWQLAVGKGYRHDPMMHGPILYHWTALMYLLFGVSDFTARLFGALSGIALVATPLLLRKWLGRFGALAAGVLLLLSPSIMMYSRYIRHDISIELATVLMLIGFIRYLDDRRPRWIITAFVGAAIGITSAEMSYITGFVLVAFIGLALWVEWAGAGDGARGPWGVRLGIAAVLVAAAFGVRRLADVASLTSMPAAALAAVGVALAIALAAVGWLLARAAGAAGSDRGATAVAGDPGWLTPVKLGLALLAVGALLRLPLDPSAAANSAQWYLGKVGVSLMVAGVPFVAVGAVAAFVPLPAAADRLAQLVVGAVAALTYILFAEGFVSHGVTTAFDAAYYAWSIAGVLALAVAAVWLLLQLPRRRVWALLAVVGWALLAFDLAVQYGGAADRFAGWQSTSAIVGGLLLAVGAAVMAFDLAGRAAEAPAAWRRWLGAAWPNAIGIGLGIVAFALAVRGQGDVSHLTKIAEPLAVASGIVLALAIGAAMLAPGARPERGVLRQLNAVPYEGVVIAGVAFIVLYLALFTTWFQETDLANGFARSLKYWWSQHDVQRGGQPWYFYILVIGPLYEWLPMALSAVALGLYARRPALRFGRGNDSGDDGAPSPAAWAFVPMIVVWMLGVWWIFSWAGEKMPWLITHMAVPMILLAARAVADLGAQVDLAAWRAKGWQVTSLTIAALALLAGLVARSTSLAAAEAARPAWVGWAVAAVLVVALLSGVRAVGGELAPAARRHALGLGVGMFALAVSGGYALLANFKNSELGTEYLVYAHGTPEDKDVYELLQRMDQARPDQPLKVGFDNEVSWPFTWYFRNICPPRARGLAADLACLLGQGCPDPTACSDWRVDPKYLADGKNPPVDVAGLKELDAVLVGSPNYGNFEPYLRKDFVEVEVNRMYWPNEGYKGLTWSRIRDALVVPELRANLLRIIVHREYVVDPLAKPLAPKSLDDWFYHAKMKLWVKKSTAQALEATGQDWPEWMKGVSIEPEADHSVPFEIDRAFTEADGLAFNAPKDVAVAPDGSFYVVDHGNKRLVHLAADGTLVAAIDAPVLEYSDDNAGIQPSAWGVGVGPDGAVYLADTWNNRLLVYRDDAFTERTFGTGGVPASADVDLDKLFGPRDVAVGPGGELFLTDTGNKRIIVIGPDLTAVRSIGKEGNAAGEFSEPVSVAFDPETGEMVVADLWNLRIQVFDRDLMPVRQWAVDGWGSKEAAHKAYVAVGPGGTVLVTDPQGARVWIYDRQGAVLGTLDLENDPTGLLQPIGIAVAPDGSIYVASSEKNIVTRYRWPESLRAAVGLDAAPAATADPNAATATAGSPAAATATPPPTATAADAAGDAGGAAGADDPAAGAPLPSPTLGQAARP